MPVTPLLVESTKLQLRFRLSNDYTKDDLIRDLRDYIMDLELRLAEYDSLIASMETRLTIGGL